MLVREKGRFKWSGGQEFTEEELVVVRGEAHGQTFAVICAYVTPTVSDAELLSIRQATLKKIETEVGKARRMNDRIVMVGDLNLRFSESQLVKLDGPLASVRFGGFSFGPGLRQDVFSQILDLDLFLCNGLWSRTGYGSFKPAGTTPDQIWTDVAEACDECRVLESFPELSDHWPVFSVVHRRLLPKQDHACQLQDRPVKVRFDSWGHEEWTRYNWLFSQALSAPRSGDNSPPSVGARPHLTTLCETHMLKAARKTESERRLREHQNPCNPNREIGRAHV